MAQVLVVDDDVVIAQMVGRVVAFCGHVPIIETSSVDALAKHSRAGLGAAVVDYMMPGLDGVELLSALQEVSPRTRRILLTAAPQEAALRLAVSSGVIERVITKPPSINDLEYALAWLPR